ncbi:unnamed protein product, partial [Mesorhabditis belari]|uniref:Uncharacterized protein n=1 Tax=Mesorhabditis belari TaxID=2138241 RepID=A0AAF3F4F9_9BILA
MSSGPFISRKVADAEYQAYNDYLEKTEVLKKFAAAIGKLYKMPEPTRPKDPIHFIIQEMVPNYKFPDAQVAKQKRLLLVQATLQRIKKHMKQQEKQEELRRRQFVELCRAHQQF